MIKEQAATPAFTADQTHGVALQPENQLICHSDGLGWRSVYAAQMVQTPQEADHDSMAHMLVYHLSGPARSVARYNGREISGASTPRQVTLLPGGNGLWSALQAGQPEVMHVLLDRASLDGLADTGRSVELRARFGMFDPLLEQLALGVMRAMQGRPPGHALYVDCLAQAMAAHLVQHHSTLTRPERVPVPESASHWRMRRVAEYVEAHLADDLALDAIAEAAEIGPRHLTRSFKAAFGTTLHAYVIQRRIERAKETLRATDLPIVAVALACGFSDQSKLGVAFQRFVGTSPGKYRQQQ